ncbi:MULTISPECIES: hypothetical protein [Paenibacillus]|uniref:hypothetical protein n=1 Tax=Paenibacillus TaxID=44249 RepID=UPI00035D4DDF|nr:MULTISPECIES: hypothetical protein [Paenibacillus]
MIQPEHYIQNAEQAQQLIGEYWYSRLEWISGFHLYTAPNSYYEPVTIVDITFLLHGKSGNYEVMLRFTNIEQLNFQPGSLLCQISGFKINSLHDRGYTDMRYYIEDYENGELHFYCKSIELKSIEKSYTAIP